jgi:hypothetical protein
MASGATGPWKWEGTKPFYLGINDTSDDEMSMLGWIKNWTDLSLSSNNASVINGTNYSTLGGSSLYFKGTNQYLSSATALKSGQALTVMGWLYSTESTSTYRNFFDSVAANPMIWWNTSGQIEFDQAAYTTTTVYRNQWVHVALSKPSGSSAPSYYINGSLVGTGGTYSVPAVTPTWLNRADAQTWLGNIAAIQLYDRPLLASEVLQNFNAARARFGI